jgi:hypothetical protein
MLIVIGQKAVPCGDESQRAQVSISSTCTDRDVKDIDARISEPLEVSRTETIGIREPFGGFRCAYGKRA